MAITFRKGNAPATEKPKEGRSALLYGPPFSGKTSTLQYDKSIRVLLLDLDKNSGVLDSVDNVDVLGVNTLEDVQAIRLAIASGAGYIVIPGLPGRLVLDYDLYTIDSFTTLEEAIKNVIPVTFAPKRKREIEGRFGAQTDWDDLQRMEVDEFRQWQKLTRNGDKSINVLWMGHDMEARESTEFNQIIQLRLQGKYAAPGIMGATDGIFYMFKQKVKPAKDKPEIMGYGVYTDNQVHGNTTYKAGARMPARERMRMPDVIWWPKWGDIFRQLGSTILPEKVNPDAPAPSNSETSEKTSG